MFEMNRQLVDASATKEISGASNILETTCQSGIYQKILRIFSDFLRISIVVQLRRQI